MQPRSTLAADLALIGLVAAVSALALHATAGMPPSRWEPIGPAWLPRALAAGLLILAALLAAGRGMGWILARRRARAKRPAAPAAPTTERVSHRRRPGRALALLAVIAAVVAAMNSGLAGYRPAAFLAVLAGCLVLAGGDRRVLLPASVLAAVLSFGVHAMLTRVLVTNLP